MSDLFAAMKRQEQDQVDSTPDLSHGAIQQATSDILSILRTRRERGLKQGVAVNMCWS